MKSHARKINKLKVHFFGFLTCFFDRFFSGQCDNLRNKRRPALSSRPREALRARKRDVVTSPPIAGRRHRRARLAAVTSWTSRREAAASLVHLASVIVSQECHGGKPTRLLRLRASSPPPLRMKVEGESVAFTSAVAAAHASWWGSLPYHGLNCNKGKDMPLLRAGHNHDGQNPWLFWGGANRPPHGHHGSLVCGASTPTRMSPQRVIWPWHPCVIVRE